MPEKKSIEQTKKKSKAGTVELTENELNEVHGGQIQITQPGSEENALSLKGGGTMTVKVEKSEFKWAKLENLD